MRVDNLYRFGFIDKNVDVYLVFSSYFSCAEV